MKAMSTNITLIGMAGVGKSVIGRELARRLDYAFVEIDEIIERATGQKLQETLDNSGDEKFLEIEERAVLSLGKVERSIISPGGSVIYSRAAMQFLREHSAIVFLHASFGSIENRLANKDTRGIVGLKKKGLRALFEDRLPLYRNYADIVIEISETDGIDAVVNAIIQRVCKR